jgi:hypothetical protein
MLHLVILLTAAATVDAPIREISGQAYAATKGLVDDRPAALSYDFGEPAILEYDPAAFVEDPEPVGETDLEARRRTTEAIDREMGLDIDAARALAPVPDSH